MNRKLKSYLVIFGHLTIGVIILISTQKITLPEWLNVSIIVFIAFLILNLIHLYVFKLDREVKEFWTLRKIPFLFLGVFGGALIALSPMVIGLATQQQTFSEITFNSDISIISIGLTFIIISWEELWFRGLFLNYCQKHLSSINLSLTIGLLFMLIHILNPKIDLLKTGPSLFFAGALLTILYFYYKTIWLPVGLHFGNNFIGTVLNTKNDSDVLFGNDGYVSAIVLSGLLLVYVIKTRKLKMNNEQKTTNAQQRI
jgi:membrane protease YdiL (CAAX protease family)